MGINNKRKQPIMTTNTVSFVRNIDRLHVGRSTSLKGYGTVKLVKSAKSSKNHKRQFSVSGSTKTANRGGYTFGQLMSAFGLSR